MKRRNPKDFVIRRTEGNEVTRARAVNPEVISSWIEEFAKVVDQYKITPEGLINIDEVGFELNDSQRWTYCSKGFSLVETKRNKNKQTKK